jgi:hypothetical protein
MEYGEIFGNLPGNMTYGDVALPHCTACYVDVAALSIFQLAETFWSGTSFLKTAPAMGDQ